MKRQLEEYSSDDDLVLTGIDSTPEWTIEDFAREYAKISKNDVLNKARFDRALRGLRSNTIVRLEEHDLDHERVCLIIDALERNTSVCDVILDSCELSNASLCQIIDLVNRKENIQVLILRSDIMIDRGIRDFGDVDAYRIVELIKSSKTLRALSLEGVSNFTVLGHKAIFESLRHSSSLLYFSLRSSQSAHLMRDTKNGLREEAYSALCHNKNLISFCNMPSHPLLYDDVEGGDACIKRLQDFRIMMSGQKVITREVILNKIYSAATHTMFHDSLYEELLEGRGTLFEVVLYNLCKADRYSIALTSFISGGVDCPMNLHFYMGLMERQACVPYLMLRYGVACNVAYSCMQQVLSHLSSNLFELMGVTKSCRTQGGVEFGGIFVPSNICAHILRSLESDDIASIRNEKLSKER